MKVRRANEADIPAMADLGEEFWKQTRYYTKHGQPYDRDTTEALISKLLSDSGIVQVAYEGDKMVGLIMLVVMPMLYSAETFMATELAYYVTPSARSTGAGLKLLKQAENVAKQKGIRYMSMIFMQEVAPERAAKVYEGMGFAPVETTYMKELV